MERPFNNASTEFELNDRFGMIQPFPNLPRVWFAWTLSRCLLLMLSIGFTRHAQALGFVVEHAKAPLNDVAAVPIAVSGFTGVGAFQFTLQWNAAVLEFVGVDSFGITSLSSGNFSTNLVSTGRLSVSWDDATERTLADGSIAFTLRLRCLKTDGSPAEVSFSQYPTLPEAIVKSGASYAVVALGTLPGGVSVLNVDSEIVEADGTGARIRFRTTAGEAYQVQRNDNFPTGAWQTLGADTIGTGSPFEGMDAGAAVHQRCVYRLQVAGFTGRPTGFCRIPILGSSDTLVSIPFSRPESMIGFVESAQDPTVTIKGSPNWIVNQWVYAAGSQTNTYYLQIRSGVLEGHRFRILSNQSNSLTVVLNGESLVGLQPTDLVSIVPYWTLGTVFPAGRGVHASAFPSSRLTEVLRPDLNGAGVNRSATGTYYFWQGNWRQVGAGTAIKNDDVLVPDAYFIVRHNVPVSTELMARGGVVTNGWRIPLSVRTSGKQDNIVALPRPYGVSLNESGLRSANAFSASLFPGTRTDELFVFNNSVTGKNKSPSATYYYWNSAWRRVGSGNTDVGNDIVFAPGTGVVIRKAAGSTSPTWVSIPNQ